MNINTKQITAFAVLSLFAYTANAQSATFTGNHLGAAPVDSLVFVPAAATPADHVYLFGPAYSTHISTTPLVDDVTGAITTTIVREVASWRGGPYDEVQVVDINGDTATEVVSITSDGIVLNSANTAQWGVAFDVRVTEVAVNDGLGNADSIVTTFTAQAVDADGNAIEGLSANGTDQANAYNNLVDGPLNNLFADDARLAGVTTQLGDTTSAGGDLTVSGDLTVGGTFALGAITDVEAAITDAEAAIALNTAKVSYTDAAVDARIDVWFDESMNGLGESGTGTGITDVIVSEMINGEEIITLGSNTFTFNNTTDTISTSSGNINLDADVAVTGDLAVTGDVFVGGRTLGLQSQIDTNTGNIATNTGNIAANADRIATNAGNIATNREDIDRNARGIAMVAALQHTTVLPGMTQALDLSAAHYEGETGMALNYSRRLSDTTQINFGVAATSDFDESVIKGGIGWQW